MTQTSTTPLAGPAESDSTDTLIDTVRRGVIGDGLSLSTPYGQRPLVYADYTASGRSLDFIEDLLRDRVLPLYANTHTESSATGLHTTRLRHEARAMVKRSVGAGQDHRVIFCGSGATAAINTLIRILGLNDARTGSEEQRPVVFIGPYEHHSNELPWRESAAEVVTIPLGTDGVIDVEALEDALVRHADRPVKIGSFSAASNVTGVRSDVPGISRLLHRHGALAFWDYAAAAPYVGIHAAGQRDDQGDSSQDALFLSPHKFVGGPGTPGVLVVKEQLLRNLVPSTPGGGTVSFVTPEEHDYLPPGERREEGGTPAIVESVRCGLVFQLKDAVGADVIEQREQAFVREALARWGRHPGIEILGHPEAPRLGIFSFNIRHAGKVLHYGFVAALMNDLFGLQVRGGCACAGPYGHTLLDLDRETSRALQRATTEGLGILRPGWVRLSFNYFFDRPTVDYILRAVELVAEHGWKLAGDYAWDAGRGVWQHRHGAPEAAFSLDEIRYTDGHFGAPPSSHLRYDRPLAELADELEGWLEDQSPRPMAGSPLPAGWERWRWFSLPGLDREACD